MKMLDYADPVDAQGEVEPISGLREAGVVIGELIALTHDGCVPLITLPGGTQAIMARSTVDLHGEHIGESVVVTFEGGDRRQPIVIGVLRAAGWPHKPDPRHVQVEADGQRFVVTAKNQLVLRCGKASITLTKTGKVLIQGTYLSSRSSGVNRIKGGSIQLN